MARNMQYCSVSRAQWQHIGFNSVHDIRAQRANENQTGEQVSKQGPKSPRQVKSKERELTAAE